MPGATTMTDASGGNEADLDVYEDDEDDDDGWGSTGFRDRLFGGPPLWLALVAAVLFGLGLLNGVAAWQQFGDFSCSGDECDERRWYQLQSFLSSASIYLLAATAALIGHAVIVDRYAARSDA
jgi:hypothetical protein